MYTKNIEEQTIVNNIETVILKLMNTICKSVG